MRAFIRQLAALPGICLALLIHSAAAEPAEKPTTAVTGCSEQVPSELAPHWQRICRGEPRNMVLDHMHGGMAAMATGHLDLAEDSFDRVLAGIETVYAESETAAKARSVWFAEAIKDFKGEPHERVMAYYYRGLLYLARGDWDNAQASFQGGILQDTFAEDARFRADVASLVWLQGWANRCRGNEDRAKELFGEARDINPRLAAPKADQTLLIIAETGQGPSKFAAGQGGQTLGFREGLVGNYSVTARVDTTSLPMVAAEDTFFQAVTRGGRPADKIVAEKLETKQTTAALGQAAMIAGAGTLAFSRHSSDNNRQNNNAAALGAAVGLIGLLAYAAAQGMVTEVDTRTWIGLPHTVHMVASPPARSGMPAGFDLLDPAGRSILVSREAVLHTAPGACSLAWVGAHNVAPSLAVAASAPGEPGGNCRTSTGQVATMPPATCLRIGGQPLGPNGPQPCRTADGGSTALEPETCRRIGGRPE